MSVRRLLPSGVRSFQNFLQNELANLQQSPILIISSEHSTIGGTPVTPITEASRYVQFTLSQRFSLRTVPATISSAFPSTQDLESRLDLLRRTGASSIVAVGSGAAMDFAKALAAEDVIDQLVLVPSTHSAMICAGSSHSLLLDPAEETLIPNTSLISCPTTAIALDSKYTATREKPDVILQAILSIVLDSALRESADPKLDPMISKLHNILSTTHEGHEVLTHEGLLSMCFEAGSMLSYGLGEEDRSSPIALASSLIPTIFPDVHILDFWAKLVPGLCHILQSKSTSGTTKELVEIVMDMKSWKFTPPLKLVDESLKGFSIPDMALSHIQSNSATCKTFDLPNDMLIEILRNSLVNSAFAEDS